MLVLGANGQLGKALKKVFPEATFFGREECDLSDPEQIHTLPFTSVDVIVNAAAYTAVDAAETAAGKVLAEAINARAVALLAQESSKHDVTLVHVSTDYVFDGSKKDPYLETDELNPLSVYAQTKAAGDIAVEKAPKHYIVRTSWVIGEGNNFVRTMASLAERGIAPSVVNDQIGRLTFTQDLAEGIKHLLSVEAPYGTYNLTNEGPQTSWADIAAKVFELTGHEPDNVTGVTTAEYFDGKEGIAPRPLWSMLNLSKIESTGFTPENWETRIAEYLA